MKILVTGGNGFIGSQVVNELLARNIEVVVFDLLPGETREGVQQVEGTILDTFSISRALKGCDGVIHLAAMLGVQRTEYDTLGVLTVNIQGTSNVLQACINAGVGQCMITSSSEIFGDICQNKIDESSPFNPKSAYAVSKLAGEAYLQGFHKEFGIDYNIIRFFNIYGPGQVAEFVVPKFIQLALEGKAPTVYGDGKQIRSFCHMTDAARALIDVFLSKDAKNETFNIGNDEEPITMLELANKVVELSGIDAKPQLIPFENSDRNSSREIFHRIPDISKLRERFNYTPSVTIEAGIKDLLETRNILPARF